ncbi:MAG: hypothetical protein VR65_12690 [Desulfobulbaceae bacterium BRH_c16a]|nr:MAG: hypothetical protein VR65_12690 [Desulfobulbaceae bacterium BRH_c16a]
MAKKKLSSFNPLQEKGMALDKQTRSWSDLTGFQYDKQEVHPYTRTRIIAMNGIEVDAAIFKHMMARMTTDPEVKKAIAVSRRIEQQQQKAVSGMIPGNETTLENTIGYEQVAVDLTAWCARHEPDSYLRQAYDFALLEDFDHLYRYANMLDMQSGTMKPEHIVGKLTEIMPGRPTVSEHRHPMDSICRPMDIKTAAPISLLNVMTIVAAEQQTMNFYMNVANRYEDPILRGLYTEIGMIEEQHVSHYESLLDPSCSWMMCMVMHEYHECYLYHAFMQQEVDPRVKKIWELHLDMELGHLQSAVELYKKIEGEDPAEFLPAEMPDPLTFESNIEYVRQVVEAQVQLTADGADFVPVDSLPRDHRFFAYQAEVNAGMVPSQEVIKKHVSKHKQDYRFETAPHPVSRFQDRKDVPEY